MARRIAIALAALVIVLLAGAIGAYAYDTSRSDEIAEGVRVGTVDVGGMQADQARAVLRRRIVKPLDRAVTVTHDGVKYRLNADRLDLRADLDGMVESALEVSRNGSLPVRVWRYATGEEIDRELAPQLSYSKQAVDDFVAKVAGEIDRDPVDATVEPGPSSLGLVEGQEGRKLRADELRERVVSAALDPHGRRVKAPVGQIDPEVTKEELAARYPTYITVNRSTFELRLWKNLDLAKTYTIAVGQAGYDTPTGVYTIQNKVVDPSWHVPDSDWAGDLAGQVIPPGPDNPLKSRWMGIYDGAGIHGTDDLGSLGSAASHGCIRMAVPEVQELYDRIDVGTPIYIGG